MTRRFIGAVLVAVAGMMSAVAATQQSLGVASPAAAIRLRATTFSPAPGLALDEPSDRPDVPGRAERRGEYLVQFQGPVQDAWKAAVASAGAEMLEYVPDFAFRVRMSAAQAARLGALPFVAWVGPYRAVYKMPPVGQSNAEQPYLVRLEPAADAAVVETTLKGAGVPVVRRGRSLLMISARPAQLAAVAQVTSVASIEPFALRVKHNEFGGGLILGSRAANDLGFDGSSQILAVADTGLGNGTAPGAHADISAARVMSILNRPGIPDSCFETIIDDGAADVDTGHGTHVATAALGFGNASGVGRGTAPASGLVFQAVENYAIPSFVCNLFYGLTQGYYLVGIPGDLGDLFQEAYEAGARIHSDSWGSAAAGAYTADSESTDAFIWNHRDMAVVFSAGNSGVDADADGLVDPVSLGAPATAKNVITVGASENDRQSHWECDAALSYGECANQGGQNHVFTYGEAWPGSFPAAPLRDDSSAGNAEQMAAFSSRGPTTDGRIKPDVVAPGTWTLSGYSDLYQQQYDAELNPQNGAYQYDGWGYPADEAHKYMGGTSMAAPLVAGGAAVVRDFYQKALGHPASAALVKATLINSAVDLLDENNDGLLDNAFPIPNGHEGWGRVDLAAATDGTQQYSDETAPMSTGVTASYTFTVADAGYPFKATLAWTDYASTPTAAVHLVNDLDLTVIASDGTMYLGNAFARGWSAVGGTPDRINNVENVYVPSAPAGTWTVIVSGYNIPMGPQPFALVVDQGPQGGSPLPVLRASAIDATATEAGPTGGLIDIIRTGDTSSELTVYYTVSGTATAGVDYVTLTGTVTIPVGASEASVSVDALDDLTSEPAETVVLTLEPDSAYIVKSPGSATVTIESDDLPPDLVISAVAGPAWAAAGDAVSVTDTTRNQGSQSTPSSATGFYLSTNSTLDQSDIFLGRRVVSSLAAAASEAATTELLIPASTTAGTYYVVAKADWDGQVEETSESNNTRASSAVRVGPDLLVSALSAPSTAAAGGTVQVGDTTKNQGAGASAVSVTTFYLSANVSWDAGDVAIGSRTVPALAGGATDTSSTSLLIPASTTAGTYYILARADGGDAVPEVAEHNNVRASASVRIGADLLVLALTAPTTAGNGEAITVTDTTKNGGGADAPASTTEYYLSVDTVFDAASDVWIGSRSVPALAAGASHTASVALVVPSETAIGTYYVLARADGPDVVVETSESNNVRASGAMKLGPDLAVVYLITPATGGAGATLVVTETIRNDGGSASPATESVFYLSTDRTLDEDDPELGRRPVPILPSGASDVASLSFVLSESLDTGTYYVISLVDPQNLVPEPVESNNVKSSAAVRVGPDLAVSSVTGPKTTTRGATIAVTDTVRNQGGGAADATVTRFYLSTNSALDATDLLLGSRELGPLNAGATSTGSTSLVIPAGLTPKSYYVIARTDDLDTLVETAENNNTRAMSLKVNP